MDTIKRNDTWPYLTFAFVDKNGSPISCVGFSVKIVVRNRMVDEPIISATVGTDPGAVWIDQSQGTGEYQWQTGNTSDAGTYYYEFEFTRIADGKVFSIPNDTYLEYQVKEDIG